MNRILLGSERNTSSLHIIGTAHNELSYPFSRNNIQRNSRTRPAHQGILPASAPRENIPINAPALHLRTTALHRIPRRLVYPDRSMTQFRYISHSSPELHCTRCTTH